MKSHACMLARVYTYLYADPYEFVYIYVCIYIYIYTSGAIRMSVCKSTLELKIITGPSNIVVTRKRSMKSINPQSPQTIQIFRNRTQNILAS